MRDDGGQGPDGGHGGGEEWLDSGAILKADLLRFALIKIVGLIK